MRLHLFLATLAFSAAFGNALAAGFPERPVRVVVNVTPGGGVDTAARIIALELAKRTGQPFVVDNRAGASGNIGAETVFRAPPDGHTLLATVGATLSINDLLFKNLGYDPQALAPVVLLTSVPLALIVRSGFPAKDVAGFAEQLRAPAGKVNVASNGNGTASHLTALMFASTVGARLNHIPYKGTAPVLNDLLGGNVDATFIQYSAFYDQHQAGRVRILAVAAEKRVPALPNIPTVAEAGYPGVLSHTWNAIAAPPKTPRPVMQWLNQAVNDVLRSPETQARFAAIHTTVEGGSVDDARRYVAADRARWSKVIKDARIQPE